jgi:hypothetical protein
MAFHGTEAGLFRGGRARGRRATRDAAPARRSNALGLIGLDVASRTSHIDPRRVLPVLVVVLAVALGVAALRTELLRVRYALAEATLEEQRLLDEERALTAERRKLRDPVHLARRAEALGFVRPEHLIDLPAAPGADDAGALADASRPGRP